MGIFIQLKANAEAVGLVLTALTCITTTTTTRASILSQPMHIRLCRRRRAMVIRKIELENSILFVVALNLNKI